MCTHPHPAHLRHTRDLQPRLQPGYPGRGPKRRARGGWPFSPPPPDFSSPSRSSVSAPALVDRDALTVDHTHGSYTATGQTSLIAHGRPDACSLQGSGVLSIQPPSESSLGFRQHPPRHLQSTVLAAYKRPSTVSIDRARAPQVRHTFPPPLLQSLYLLQYFLHLSPPPSELILGGVLRRLDRVHTVVQPIGLTVELPSTTHGPSSSRTWIGRTPGRTLLGAPLGLRRRHPRWHSAWLHH